MSNAYSNEQSILELVSLLKAHNVHNAVVSPGSTNISFAASILYDPDIKVYSCIDERSAAYMACGLAEETGEPVVISCTGATAARNYVPALTEAFYRKLPIIAVTSSQHFGRVGQNIPQVTDRTNPMNDICVKCVQIPVAYTEEDKWANNLKMNDAILESKRNGGGPVIINIQTTFSKVFDVKSLPHARVIKRVTVDDAFPEINAKRIAIFVGAHSRMDQRLTKAIEVFCEHNNAIVVCDHTSNYKGKYRVLGGLVERQTGIIPECRNADLLIHLGEMSGSYFKFDSVQTVWRVHKDGEIKDTYKHLSYVFEMSETRFFEYYNQQNKNRINTYYDEWCNEEKKIITALPELPFSNAWVAQQTAGKLPTNSEIHFGILNSLRMWNLFDLPSTVYGYSNVGGFGIDGSVSTLIGASLANQEKLYYLVLGDLSTFYDLNAFGNRHIGNNLRILIVNNGVGFEMRHSGNRGDVFREDANILFAAGGHFGNKSRDLIKNYTTDLGFEYITASTKEEYLKKMPYFVGVEKRAKSIVFEVFVDVNDEYDSYEMTKSVIKSSTNAAKGAVKNLLGEKGVRAVKELLGKK